MALENRFGFGFILDFSFIVNIKMNWLSSSCILRDIKIISHRSHMNITIASSRLEVKKHNY